MNAGQTMTAVRTAADERLAARITEFGRADLADDRVRKTRAALGVATGAWLAATVVTFLVWALVCVIGLDWQEPWWLWTLITPAPVLGLVAYGVAPDRLAQVLRRLPGGRRR